MHGGLGPVSDYEFSDGSGTVEMFLYQTATAAFNPCFFSGRDDSASPAVRYSLHGGTAGNQLFIWNGSAAPSVTTVSMLNNLVHIAYVFDAGLVTVYCNGATNATLVISPVTLADNTSTFRCVIYNPFGGTNSASALLAVRTPPSFVVAPADMVRYITQPGSLSAVVNGLLPLSFQWFKNSVLIPNATNALLNFASLDAAIRSQRDR